jgi:hypothetical protein
MRITIHAPDGPEEAAKYVAFVARQIEDGSRADYVSLHKCWIAEPDHPAKAGRCDLSSIERSPEQGMLTHCVVTNCPRTGFLQFIPVRLR